MASYINMFLKTEVTVIPRLLDKYFGKYYNNTLCNGMSWMFLFWYILHLMFDELVNALLRKMKYKEYVRIRLKMSLWYLGFYCTANIYCIGIFYQNNVQFYTNKPFHNSDTLSNQLILGFIVISTFYLHSAFWERLKYCHQVQALSYLCLFLLLCFSYFFRFVEDTFRLTILICATQITLELTRCATILIKRNEINGKVICGTLFISNIFCCALTYLVVIYFLLDSLSFSASIAILLVFLLSWLIGDIYISALFKTIVHWLYHRSEDESICEKDILECALFQPRDDATYNFVLLRREIKERQAKSLSLRRPKNRNMVVQTLKCMVAIKRKLNVRRQTANSIKEDSDLSAEITSEAVENMIGVFRETYQDSDMRNITDNQKTDDFSQESSEASNDKSTPENTTGQVEENVVMGSKKQNIQEAMGSESNECHNKKCKED